MRAICSSLTKYNQNTYKRKYVFHFPFLELNVECNTGLVANTAEGLLAGKFVCEFDEESMR